VAKQAHKSKQKRFEEVIEAALIIEHRQQSITAAAIAMKLNMAVSTHLRKIIKAAVEQGFLQENETIHWNGWRRSVYAPQHQSLSMNCPDWYKDVMARNGLYISMFTVWGDQQ